MRGIEWGTAADWTGAVIALLALAGSAIGFFWNRHGAKEAQRDAADAKKAADESVAAYKRMAGALEELSRPEAVRWRARRHGSIVQFENAGDNAALEVEASGSSAQPAKEGRVPPGSAIELRGVLTSPFVESRLKVTWTEEPGGERKTWTSPVPLDERP